MSHLVSSTVEHRALVLDDEPNVGAIVCKALAAAGLQPQFFQSVTPFLVELKKTCPELVVLDLALGSTDAVEVIRKLEALQYSGRVLLISGHDEATLKDINDIGLRHGLRMLTPLRKPFRANELKDRLATEVLIAPAGAASKPAEADITVNLKEAIDN